MVLRYYYVETGNIVVGDLALLTLLMQTIEFHVCIAGIISHCLCVQRRKKETYFSGYIYFHFQMVDLLLCYCLTSCGKCGTDILIVYHY